MTNDTKYMLLFVRVYAIMYRYVCIIFCYTICYDVISIQIYYKACVTMNTCHVAPPRNVYTPRRTSITPMQVTSHVNQQK